MIYIVLNLIPIGIAAAAALILGFLRHRAGGGGQLTPSVALTALVAHFWFAAILAGALILAPPRADPWVMALATPVVIWVGFVLPALVLTGAYRGLRMRHIAGDCSYWLAAMVVEAAVMTLIGLVPPPAG